MNCCDDFGNCRQGRDCPVRNCKHCYGIGYDASGQRCECQPSARTVRIERLRKLSNQNPDLVAYRDAIVTRLVLVCVVVGAIWIGHIIKVAP